MSTNYICGCVEADGVRNYAACGEGHLAEPPAEAPEPEEPIEDDVQTKKAPAKKVVKKVIKKTVAPKKK